MAQTKAQLLAGKADQDVNFKTLALAGATSGTATIAATSIAGTPTLTLPDTSGTLDRLNRAGNILQVVNATYSTGVNSSSLTFADTGLTATITPTSASSKILVLVSQVGCFKNTGDTFLALRLLRGATLLVTFEQTAGYNSASTENNVGTCSATYLDSPNTTTSITYKTQLASANNVALVGVQRNSATSTITLMEVAA